MIHVVLLAAGKSERYGKPKLLEKLDDITILEVSMDTLQSCDVVDDVILVSSGRVMVYALKISKKYPKISKVVKGGKTRRDSSKAGVDSIVSDDDVVLIHDAARPFASCALFERVAKKAKSCGAAVPVVNLRDTVAFIEKDEISKIPDREKLRSVQTPQGFLVGLIKRAHKEVKSNVTDDSKLVLELGERVCFVDGEMTNFKITFPIDLLVAKAVFLENSEKFHR